MKQINNKMENESTKPDEWRLKLPYTLYEDLLNGEALVLTYNKEKNEIVVFPSPEDYMDYCFSQ